MRSWWLRLAHYARPHALGLSLITFLMLIGVGFDLLKPWPLKLIIDHVLRDRPLPGMTGWIAHLPGGESPGGQLTWLASGVLLLFLAHQAITILQGYIQAGVGQRMSYELGGNLFGYLQRLSLRFHGRRPAGDLVRRVTTDSACVRDLFMSVVFPVLTSVLTVLTMFAIMWRLDRSLALLALLVIPAIGLLIRFFDRSMTQRTYAHQQLEGEMMAAAEQALTAVPIVQAFNREVAEERQFRDLSQRAFRASVRAVAAQAQFRAGVSTATAIGTAAVMIVGGNSVLQGRLSLGGLLVCLTYLASLYAPLSALTYLSSGFASASARARRVIEVLDVDEQVRDLPGAQPRRRRPGSLRGQVRLENVTFGYEPDRPVLHGVSLEAEPGEVVALVGKTGAGKSSLVSLIARLFDPWEGRVLLDGVDVRQIRLACLRAEVALVLQDPFLLPLTVAENIAYGRPEARRKEIVAAAKAANAEEFIERLPDGYDTRLEERGVNLSGGQKQRLAIARALLKDAAVLILDEPTSALDTQTEAEFLEALEQVTPGRTTFIIAHRLSTIQRADRIIVVDEGRIVESGAPGELLASRGLYHHFHSLQVG
ncbi:MAG: ABC transporter ATP-binding protein [Acidobacteria bacterium]|nr:MAG: ABC transporter ATP-binding protein [Acidobacteriota bacterium]